MCCTSLPRVPPVVVRGLKFWAVQNFLLRSTPFRFFSASCHVYKSTVARLKLDINANNIVCFTGDHFLTVFGRDQAVKCCVTGPLAHDCHYSGAIGLCNGRGSYWSLAPSPWYQGNCLKNSFVEDTMVLFKAIGIYGNCFKIDSSFHSTLKKVV